MEAGQEHQLRARVTDLVVDWHEELAGGSLDTASSADFEHLIDAASVVADESGESLRRWVHAGKHAGLSWADIGSVLGISRQAAQQRFSSPNTFLGVGLVGAEGDGLILRSGMNAFNEVAVLEEEGTKGNELVGAAPFKLFFTPRGRQWENIRVTAVRRASVIKHYEAEGWTHALTWYPFVYFTRRVEETDGASGA